MKNISVIIPCYNQGKYLEEAVQSVISQSYPAHEIIIINDGSTDPFTVDLLSSYHIHKCNIIHTKNQGLPAARNRGIAHSTGEFICCLDADDKYDACYFQKAMDVFNQDETMRYGAVTSWVQMFGCIENVWQAIGFNTEGFKPCFQGTRNNIQSATMFRKRCWEEIGGYDESMTRGYEDWDFWLRIIDRGYEWYCIEEPLIYYRQKEHSMVKDADSIREQLLGEMIAKNRNFYEKYLTEILLERDKEVRIRDAEIAFLKEQVKEAGRKKNFLSKIFSTR